MKALRTILTAIVLLAGATTMNAQRMSIVAMQNNAMFLTDRMAYTLGIRDPYLIDEIYRINYDYIWGVNDYLDDVALGYYYDDYMEVCAARDVALRNLLGYNIWNRLIGYTYFYRPIVFANHGWRFSIYDYDRYGHRHYYYSAPRPIARGYAGGHYFRGMPPRAGRPAGPAPHRHPGAGPAPHVGRGGAPAPHVNHGAAPDMNRGGSRPDVNRGNNNRPDVNRGGNNRPDTNRGGATDVNHGNNNRPDMNRSGNTPHMRSDHNRNSSSRQNFTHNTAPTLRNASITTRGGGAPASRGGAPSSRSGAPRHGGRR